MNKQIPINILKTYTYRGGKIFIRQIGGYIFEYLVVYKDNLWADFFYLDDLKQRKLNKQQAGATTFLVCNAAEGLMDQLVRKHSFWYNVFWKRFTPAIPVKEEKGTNTK